MPDVQPPRANSSRSTGRRTFFLVTAVWGFLLGWVSLPLGLALSDEHRPIMNGWIVTITTSLLLLALLGAFVLNRSYSEYRSSKKR